MQIFTALLTGLLFGLGLILSGMTNPAKVIGFLDLAGSWDPSLAFVMGGAIAVATLGFMLAGRRSSAVLGGPMQLPTRRDIDPRLVIGSLLFGMGWGLGGFCPGPALVSLGRGVPSAAIFVAAMLIGMLIYEFIERATRSSVQSSTTRTQGTSSMSTPYQSVNGSFSVAPQLQPADMALAKAAGFRSIINNRPDFEHGPDQPTSAMLEEAAVAAGLRYAWLPVIPSDIKPEEIAAMAKLIAELPGPVLAFCRSGARASKLYQLAMTQDD